MSQQHNDALKRLFPIALGPVHEADAALEGSFLDTVQVNADELLENLFPDGAHRLLPSWERVLDLKPDEGASTTVRQAACVSKLRETGGLSREYFIQLAAAMGYVIEIREPWPFMAGIGMAGYPVYVEDVLFTWEVVVEGTEPPSFPFYAGTSSAGDPLLSFPFVDLVTVFNRLKPAHTYVFFTYTGP